MLRFKSRLGEDFRRDSAVLSAEPALAESERILVREDDLVQSQRLYLLSNPRLPSAGEQARVHDLGRGKALLMVDRLALQRLATLVRVWKRRSGNLRRTRIAREHSYLDGQIGPRLTGVCLDVFLHPVHDVCMHSRRPLLAGTRFSMLDTTHELVKAAVRPIAASSQQRQVGTACHAITHELHISTRDQSAPTTDQVNELEKHLCKELA